MHSMEGAKIEWLSYFDEALVIIIYPFIIRCPCLNTSPGFCLGITVLADSLYSINAPGHVLNGYRNVVYAA